MNRTLLAAVVIALLPAVAGAAGDANQRAQSVSLVSLIAAPQRFQGTPVRVQGALLFESESSILCLHTEDLLYYLRNNCVAVEPNFKALGVSPNYLTGLSGKYVLVEGTFNNGSVPSISGLWRVVPVPPRRVP